MRGQWLKTAKALGKNNDHLMEKWIVDAFNTARGNEETVFKVVQGCWEGYFGLVSAYLHAANPAKHVGKVLNCADGDGSKTEAPQWPDCPTLPGSMSGPRILIFGIPDEGWI